MFSSVMQILNTVTKYFLKGKKPEQSIYPNNTPQ